MDRQCITEDRYLRDLCRLRQLIRRSWIAMLSLLIIDYAGSAGTLVSALPSILV